MSRYKKLKDLDGNFGFTVYKYNGVRSLTIMLDRKPVATMKTRKSYKITMDLAQRVLQIKKASISAGLLATTE